MFAVRVPKRFRLDGEMEVGCSNDKREFDRLFMSRFIREDPNGDFDNTEILFWRLAQGFVDDTLPEHSITYLWTHYAGSFGPPHPELFTIPRCVPCMYDSLSSDPEAGFLPWWPVNSVFADTEARLDDEVYQNQFGGGRDPRCIDALGFSFDSVIMYYGDGSLQQSSDNIRVVLFWDHAPHAMATPSHIEYPYQYSDPCADLFLRFGSGTTQHYDPSSMSRFEVLFDKTYHYESKAVFPTTLQFPVYDSVGKVSTVGVNSTSPPSVPFNTKFMTFDLQRTGFTPGTEVINSKSKGTFEYLMVAGDGNQGKYPSTTDPIGCTTATKTEESNGILIGNIAGGIIEQQILVTGETSTPKDQPAPIAVKVQTPTNVRIKIDVDLRPYNFQTRFGTFVADNKKKRAFISSGALWLAAWTDQGLLGLSTNSIDMLYDPGPTCSNFLYSFVED